MTCKERRYFPSYLFGSLQALPKEAETKLKQQAAKSEAFHSFAAHLNANIWCIKGMLHTLFKKKKKFFFRGAKPVLQKKKFHLATHTQTEKSSSINIHFRRLSPIISSYKATFPPGSPLKDGSVHSYRCGARLEGWKEAGDNSWPLQRPSAIHLISRELGGWGLQQGGGGRRVFKQDREQ